MRTHIVICDDILEHRLYMRQLIEEGAKASGREVAVDLFPDSEALLAACLDHATMDIAVLDIEMDDMDGISLAKRINELVPHCQIVFITAYSHFAMDAYEAEHVCLILKERMEEGLWPAIEKASAKLDRIAGEGLAVKTADGVCFCAYSEILYLEHLGRKTNVVTSTHTITTKSSISSLCQSLPEYFYLCHQSFVVNLRYVSAMDKDCYILLDKTRIPISRAKKAEAKDAFWSYLNASVLKRGGRGMERHDDARNHKQDERRDFAPSS